MVEELIAEGWAPDDIVALLVRDYGVSVGDAGLTVQTALGGPGDVLEVVEDWEYDDDEDDLGEDVVAAVTIKVAGLDLFPVTAAAMFDESKHPRFESGRREGGRFAPKAGTSTAAAQDQALEQAAKAQEGEPEAMINPVIDEGRWLMIGNDDRKLAELSDAELVRYRSWAESESVRDGYYTGLVQAAREEGQRRDATMVRETGGAGVVTGVRRMDVKATNPVYVGKLDGETVVLKPEMQLSPTRLRTNVEPGFDLEREKAAAHVASLMRESSPDVAPLVPDYRITDVEGYGRSGVSDYVRGETAAEAHHRGDYQIQARLGGDQWDADMKNIRMFDGVIGNTDRHEGNLMIDLDGRLHAIDHGLAFPSGNREDWPNIQGGQLTVALSPVQRSSLEQMRPRLQADPVLPSLLTGDQMKAMDDRIGFMLAKNRLPKKDDWLYGFTVDDGEVAA